MGFKDLIGFILIVSFAYGIFLLGKWAHWEFIIKPPVTKLIEERVIPECLKGGSK